MFDKHYNKRFKVSLLVLTALLVSVVAMARPTSAQTLTKVRVQLKWVAQAQFAGYYIAKEKGYYADVGLDVEILPGGPDITPLQVLAGGGAEFALAWMPDGLAGRDKGADFVNIAQVYTRSGMRHISWKDSNIKTVADMKGKKVGVWCCGNQYELYAALVKNKMSPENADEVTIVNQPFDMNLFLNREIDAAAAMTYNELAQVLETVNPKTGKLYTLDELNVISFSDEGTDMLQDSVYASAAWLAKTGNEDIATKFLAATFAGWAFARDNLTESVDIVLKAGTTLGKGHQTWQMNEVSKLIWPAPKGVGIMDPDAFKRTAEISLNYKVIEKAATDAAYRTDLAEKATALAKTQFKLDPIGESWKPVTVEITEGGK